MPLNLEQEIEEQGRKVRGLLARLYQREGAEPCATDLKELAQAKKSLADLKERALGNVQKSVARPERAKSESRSGQTQPSSRSAPRSSSGPSPRASTTCSIR